MLKNKVVIIGTCVTRDVFRIMNKNDDVNIFSNSSSLISRVSKPVDLNLNLEQFLSVSDLSNFKKRMVKQDFEKSYFSLQNQQELIVIIDLMDERWNLMKIGDSYITETPALVNSGISSYLKENNLYEEYYVRCGTYGEFDEFDLWIKSLEKFSEIMQSFEKATFVLHRTFESYFFIKENRIEQFENIHEIASRNERYAYYYSVFEKICKPQHIIEVASDKLIADANHLWGLDPLHYINEYYKDFYFQLLNLVCHKSYDLFPETKFKELTNDPYWAFFSLESNQIYDIVGQIASTHFPDYNHALIQFKFFDENRNFLKPPYDDIPQSEVVGPYKYIPIDSKYLSTYVINFRSPKEAHFVELGFRSWYNLKPIIILSKLLLCSSE